MENKYSLQQILENKIEDIEKKVFKFIEIGINEEEDEENMSKINKYV